MKLPRSLRSSSYIYDFTPVPDYANYQPIGQAPECMDSDTGAEGVEMGLLYNPKLSMMNNLNPILDNVPQYIPPTDQAIDHREPGSPFLHLRFYPRA